MLIKKWREDDILYIWVTASRLWNAKQIPNINTNVFKTFWPKWRCEPSESKQDYTVEVNSANDTMWWNRMRPHWAIKSNKAILVSVWHRQSLWLILRKTCNSCWAWRDSWQRRKRKMRCHSPQERKLGQPHNRALQTKTFYQMRCPRLQYKTVRLTSYNSHHISRFGCPSCMRWLQGLCLPLVLLAAGSCICQETLISGLRWQSTGKLSKIKKRTRTSTLILLWDGLPSCKGWRSRTELLSRSRVMWWLQW